MVGKTGMPSWKLDAALGRQLCMTSLPRLERARLRVAESEHRILEQKLRIATLRADGEDTAAAVKLLDDLRVAHRIVVEQLAMEEAHVSKSDPPL